MLKQGYKQVGKDFPVFLHPETNEEYALARKERRTSLGHKGFDFNFEKDVTLEEDLYRRDLTINAFMVKSLRYKSSSRVTSFSKLKSNPLCPKLVLLSFLAKAYSSFVSG